MSHQYWRERLVRWLEEEWSVSVTQVTLPGRYFSWRFRGNSLTLSHDERLSRPYDLIIATSMTDLATLIGLQPGLSGIPVILYFHENQFAYPDQFPERQVERQITSIYSAIAATQLVFNSEFNRETFSTGAQSLLARMPDGVPEGVVTGLAAKSEVIPVAIDANPSDNVRSNQLSIVWNHRWEHDKGLDELEMIVDGLLARGEEFTFHLVGQNFRQVPQQIARVRRKLGNHLGQFGYLDERGAYLELLGQSHVVLSTARHEFQGISVLEAIAAGCRPVVPDDLAYREFVAAESRFSTTQQAVELILSQKGKNPVALPVAVQALSVAQGWHSLLTSILGEN